MLTREHIDELHAFDGHGARVLSVYLDLTPPSQVRRSYRIVFEDMVKATREGLDKAGNAELSTEADHVMEWLEAHKPGGKGLALFSCARQKLWQTHFLAVPVENQLVFDGKPDVAPLLALLDEYERYAVALVDKKKARLFTVFLGEIEEMEALKDDLVPSKHDQGGVSQLKYQHHHEVHVLWHLKKVVARLAELHRRRRFDRLILAGPDEAVSELRHLLPRTLTHRLAAVIPGEMSAGDGDILKATLEVESHVEREVEQRLVDELLEMARAGGRATYGVMPTLEALWGKAVRTLVVADGVQSPGAECPNCGRLEASPVASCPACGARMRPLHDVVRRAMERALEEADRVAVVHGDAARRLGEAGAGLGALLRYR
jgi:peptide chain release factor subunit 1